MRIMLYQCLPNQFNTDLCCCVYIILFPVPLPISRRLEGENLSIHVIAERARGCANPSLLILTRLLLWLIVPALWLIGCQPAVCVCARLAGCTSVWVHVGVHVQSINLTSLCTSSHFTPAIINHNSNWPSLIPTGPLNPTIWAPISPPRAIYLSPTAWPTGQASSYLLCLCHTPLLLVLQREIWTPSCLPDSHLNPTAISLDLGDTASLPLRYRG